MSVKTRLEIEDAIKRAERDPLAFFGDDPRSVLREWMYVTHPDKWLDLDEDVAKGWFTTLSMLAEQSKIRETIGSYRVVRNLPDGDLCQIKVCEKGGAMYLAKRPAVKAPSVLKKERNNLAAVVGGANPTAKHLFPKFVEHVDGANVFEFGEDLESLLSLTRRYPQGLHGRHIIWLTKRVLLALTWTHAAGIVHGAVTPEHILVCKSNHGIVLCDWIFSGKVNDPIKFVPARYKNLYPDFATKNKKLSSRLDIAMAGKCLYAAMDADNAPWRIRNFISAMSTGVISDDAWSIHQDLDEIGRRVFGSPKWFELE